MNRLATIFFSTALVLTATTAQATTAPAVTTSETSSGGFLFEDQSDGWEFEANEDLIVTHLGLWDEADDGFALPEYEIGLFRVSDQALLTPAGLTVQSTDPIQGHFRYVALTVPINLVSGQSYVVAVYSGASAATSPGVFTDAPIGTDASYDSRITPLAIRWAASSGGLVFPDDVSGFDGLRIGPTFCLESPSTATESSTWGDVKALFQ